MQNQQNINTNKFKKDQEKKLPELQQLQLKQLESLAGGPAGDGCPWCIFN